jgi:hypothetical protein
LINAENRFLKTIFEKELCLAIDAIEEGLSGIDLMTANLSPFFRKFLGEERFDGDVFG